MKHAKIKVGGVVLCLTAGVASTSCGGGSDNTGDVAARPTTPATPPAPMSTAPPPAVVKTSPAVEGLVISDPLIAIDLSEPLLNKSFVSVQMLTQGKVTTVRSEAVPTSSIALLTPNLTRGALVGYEPHPTKAGWAKSAADIASTFALVYRAPFSGNGATRAYNFDSKKYGPELPAIDGAPGSLAASGWIYAKDLASKTITVSDGRIVEKDMAGRPYAPALKRYEETYQLADDVVVYNVNTADYAASAVSTLAAVPVTADYKYSTTERQQVYVVFDKSHQGADTAKVKALYYFTPKSVTSGKPVWDIGNNSSMLVAMGTVPASESATYAGTRYFDIPYQAVNYEQSTEPFPIVKDTLYSVGDNEVAIYLFKAGDRLIMLDAGWPNLGYQYWKNIEAMGFDPRKVTDVVLTHAHADHYGTAAELVSMIENTGAKIRLWGSSEEVNGLLKDAQGNTWNKTPTLAASQTVIRSRTTEFYQSGQTYDFGTVKMTPIITPGHTNGTYSFFFDVNNPITSTSQRFAYHGGFGWNPLKMSTAANGWQRLIMRFSLAYLQQTDQNSIVLPQHTDMSPLVEAFQAVKAYNRDPANAGQQKTVLDALTTTTGGVNEFQNMLEKRYQSFAMRVMAELILNSHRCFTTV